MSADNWGGLTFAGFDVAVSVDGLVSVCFACQMMLRAWPIDFTFSSVRSSLVSSRADEMLIWFVVSSCA